jgi:hypothetical protein
LRVEQSDVPAGKPVWNGAEETGSQRSTEKGSQAVHRQAPQAPGPNPEEVPRGNIGVERGFSCASQESRARVLEFGGAATKALTGSASPDVFASALIRRM